MTRRAGLWAVCVALACCGRGLGGELAATLRVDADAVQPAGVPVLLTLTVHNTGTEPISYWRGSAGDYPDAEGFSVTVTLAGRTRPWLSDRLSNSSGQFASGAGRMQKIKPGESLSFPAVVRPLNAGTHVLQVIGDPQGRRDNGRLDDVWFPATFSQPLKIEVRPDEALAARSDADLILRVRKGDPFAQHVAARFPRPEVRKALEADLAGDDLIAAEGAMDALWPDYNPPTADAALVARAIHRHVKPINDGHDEWLMHVLLRMAERFKTEEVKGAVGEVVAARAPGRVREYAQTAAAVLKGNSLPAAGAKRTGDQPAPDPEDPLIDALLKMVTSDDARTRIRAYELLSEYPQSPRAVEALRKGLSDRSDPARAAAEKAWRDMNANREWRKIHSLETRPAN